MPKKKKNGLLESLESLKKLQARNDKIFGRLMAVSNLINNGFENPIYDLLDTLKRQTALWNVIYEQQKTISIISRKMEALNDITNTIAQPIQQIQALNNIVNTIASPTFIPTIDEVENIYGNAKSHLETMEFLDELKELEPYLESELKKTKYQNKTIAEVYEMSIDPKNKKIKSGSPFAKLLKAARSARRKNSIEAQYSTIKKVNTIEYPLDKPNSTIWYLLNKFPEGQIALNMARSGSKQEIIAYYDIDFENLSNDLQIDKRLTPFDKRVYIAISALFNAGNNIITLTQIHKCVGYISKPTINQLEKINKSITKMTTARIFFDNEGEVAVYKYPKFKYDGSLLPLERSTAIINGRLSDAAIHIFREPPLITFAKERKQMTTIGIKLLQSPISKTDSNLQIEDYLLARISKAKKGKTHSCHILLKTLYKHAGIPDKTNTNAEKQQKKRAPNKIKKYLAHFKKEKFITQFELDKDIITVHW